MGRWPSLRSQRRPAPRDRCETDGCDSHATVLVQRPSEPFGSKRVCSDCAFELQSVYGWTIIEGLRRGNAT